MWVEVTGTRFLELRRFGNTSNQTHGHSISEPAQGIYELEDLQALVELILNGDPKHIQKVQ